MSKIVFPKMKCTDALKMLYKIMQGRPDIKQVTFNREDGTFEVLHSNGDRHLCFEQEFENMQ